MAKTTTEKSPKKEVSAQGKGDGAKKAKQATKSSVVTYAEVKAGKAIAYYPVVATCACGSSFEVGSTLESIRVDICSQCHPFFTGEKKIVDAEGRVEKFRKKYQSAKSK